MNFLVVGAGAVGRVLGTSLERAGHDVAYWTRSEHSSEPQCFEVVRAGRTPVVSAAVRWLGPHALPRVAPDQVIVCVRTEQLAAALRELCARLGPETPLLIATITFDGALYAARAAGLSGPALAFHTAFGAYFEGSRVCWFPFNAPSVVSAEAEASQLAAAHVFAQTCSSAGIPALALRSMAGVMRAFAVATTVLLPGWALCDWDLATLARDRALRAQTAGAMHEAVRAFAPPSGLLRLVLRALPRAAFSVILRILPWLMRARSRALWRAHGPKISAQTRFSVEELLARANDLRQVRALYERWSSVTPAPSGTRDRR